MTAPLITDHVWRPDKSRAAHLRTDDDECAYTWCGQPREDHDRGVGDERPALTARRYAEAEIERLTGSLQARTRALVRARAQIGALTAEAARPGYGTRLCPRCGEALAAEVAAEKAGETP